MIFWVSYEQLLCFFKELWFKIANHNFALLVMIELFHAVEGERSFGFFFLLALPDLTFIFFLSVDQYITGVDTISLSNY